MVFVVVWNSDLGRQVCSHAALRMLVEPINSLNNRDHYPQRVGVGLGLAKIA